MTSHRRRNASRSNRSRVTNSFAVMVVEVSSRKCPTLAGPDSSALRGNPSSTSIVLGRPSSGLGRARQRSTTEPAACSARCASAPPTTHDRGHGANCSSPPVAAPSRSPSGSSASVLQPCLEGHTYLRYKAQNGLWWLGKTNHRATPDTLHATRTSSGSSTTMTRPRSTFYRHCTPAGTSRK